MLYPDQYAASLSTLQALPIKTAQYRQNEIVQLDNVAGDEQQLQQRRKRVRFETEVSGKLGKIKNF